MSNDFDVIPLGVKRLDPEASMPSYAHQGDAGADLSISEDVFLSPGERVVVGTGIALAIPPGWVGLIHPRSGLAARSGLTIVNSPGTIDSGYRGEIKVCLLNTDPKMPIELKRGDKIAQLLLQRVAQAALYEVEHFDETERGEQGYGSSGGIQSWGTGGK